MFEVFGPRIKDALGVSSKSAILLEPMKHAVSGSHQAKKKKKKKKKTAPNRDSRTSHHSVEVA